MTLERSGSNRDPSPLFMKQSELAPTGVTRGRSPRNNGVRAKRSMAGWLRVLPWALYGSAALVKVGVPHTLTSLIPFTKLIMADRRRLQKPDAGRL
jgi:hypothetical protein